MRDVKWVHRPKGSNANEWHLYLRECFGGGNQNVFPFMAVQIAEAIEEACAAPPKLAPEAMRKYRLLADRLRWIYQQQSIDLPLASEVLRELPTIISGLEALSPAPVPSGDGAVKALRRELRVSSDRDYREWHQIEQAMTAILSPSDAGAAEPDYSGFDNSPDDVATKGSL